MSRRPLPFLLGLSALSLVAGCKVDREPNWEFAPWINHMMFSSAAESQAVSPKFADGKPIFKNGRSMQNPPTGTIPRGFQPLHFTADDAGRQEAGRVLKNPLDGTPANLERGEVMFKTFCAPCHGVGGAGDGPVSKRGMPGFPINSADGGAGKMPDGTIYHLITYGRGVMPSYATQIQPEDRWRILLHVRHLQAQSK